MNAEEFIAKSKDIGNKLPIEAIKASDDYAMLTKEYISSNYTYKVGDYVVLENHGSHNNLADFKKDHNVFQLNSLSVNTMLNGTPLICAEGDIFFCRTRADADNPLKRIGSFKCIVHGSAHPVIFKKSKHRMSQSGAD